MQQSEMEITENAMQYQPEKDGQRRNDSKPKASSKKSHEINMVKANQRNSSKDEKLTKSQINTVMNTAIQSRGGSNIRKIRY
jgi:hypothetical protein